MSETTAMDTREYKIAIPDKNAEEDSRADSPEQSGVCTPKNEHSSGFKRLRSWELSSLEGVERADWQGADDEAPGTSTASTIASDAEVKDLQDRTVNACVQLAEIIVSLRREREWTDEKSAKTKKKHELRLRLRAIERRITMLKPTAKLESLRKYVEYALEKAQPAAQLTDLLDDELQLILSKVNATNGSSPKQLLALSTVSKRFAKLVRQPAVWRDLDVSSHASFLTDRVLNSIVRDDGAFGMLRSVSLAGCTRVTETAIVKLLNACGNSLERLDLSGCTLVKTSTIEHAARTCTNLTLLDLTGCAHVDTLDALKMTDTFWPKLEEVRLVGTSRLSGRVCQTEFDALADEIASRWNRWREARREGRRQALLAAEMEADALKVKLATGREPAGLAELLSAEDERRRALEDLESDDAVALEEELHIDHAECDCGPAVSLEAMPALVRKCRRWVEAWQEGHPVSACDHALVMQGAMGEQAGLATLNLFPNCGHVMCEVCEQKERVNMQRRPVEGGEFEYVYPCRLCNQDMPNPGGFEITLTQ